MNEIANTTDQAVSVLDTLAAQARMLTENIALNMLQLGRVFTDAKALVPHGQWAAWVSENTGISERYAQQFMQAYSRFGESQNFAALGKSKILRLLALPEGEETAFIEANDVSAMSVRELETTIKRAREEARAEAQSEMRAEIEHAAQVGRESLTEAQRLRAENSALRNEIDDQSALLEDLQAECNRAQEELLNARSTIARGDAERKPSDQLTAETFAAAVRQFIGAVARLPHMRHNFSQMPADEISTFDELLKTVEQWAASSRKALDTIGPGGGVIL